ncbi:hypothetical protein C4J81_00420 [Deltaproteobacteria bacterium Smac51]|nr:hypothetical protein C4J81_00420 [Deltaproteobacteria bacterium Smac51]
MSDCPRRGAGFLREYGYAFRMNKTIRLYEHSLYWFDKYICRLKISNEMLTNGDRIIFGEIDVPAFRSLVLDDGLITGLSHHHWGFSWLYSRQSKGNDDSFSEFRIWRDGHLASSILNAVQKFAPRTFNFT